jgi:bacteriocin-like protein
MKANKQLEELTTEELTEVSGGYGYGFGMPFYGYRQNYGYRPFYGYRQNYGYRPFYGYHQNYGYNPYI